MEKDNKNFVEFLEKKVNEKLKENEEYQAICQLENEYMKMNRECCNLKYEFSVKQYKDTFIAFNIDYAQNFVETYPQKREQLEEKSKKGLFKKANSQQLKELDKEYNAYKEFFDIKEKYEKIETKCDSFREKYLEYIERKKEIEYSIVKDILNENADKSESLANDLSVDSFSSVKTYLIVNDIIKKDEPLEKE
jgi:hypothetical protein